MIMKIFIQIKRLEIIYSQLCKINLISSPRLNRRVLRAEFYKEIYLRIIISYKDK